MQLDEGLGHAAALAAAARGLRAAQQLRVRREPRRGTPVGAELRHGRAAVGVLVDPVRADVQPPKPARDPRPLSGDVALARGEEGVEGERLRERWRGKEKRCDQETTNEERGTMNGGLVPCSSFLVHRFQKEYRISTVTVDPPVCFDAPFPVASG